MYLIVHSESSGLFILLLLLESILPVLEILLHLPADGVIFVRALLSLYLDVQQVVESSSSSWIEEEIVSL